MTTEPETQLQMQNKERESTNNNNSTSNSNPVNNSTPTTTTTTTTIENNTSTQLSESFLHNEDCNDTLLSLSFNQDGGCLAVGTSTGFRICNVYPYHETFRRTFISSSLNQNNHHHHHNTNHNTSFDETTTTNHIPPSSFSGGGGIGSIEMLFRCNLLALVGGGSSPHYPPNKVFIWDDHLGRPIGELSFRQRVLTVRLRRDRICVALKDRVYVYNFGTLSLLDTILTGGEQNGLGLLCISTDASGGGMGIGTVNGGTSSSNSTMNGGKDDNGMVLACPSITRGQVRVELYGHRKTALIDAHDGPLAALALSVDGTLLATASERGTLIRLFDTGWKSSTARRISMEDGSNNSSIGSSSSTLNSSQSSLHPPGTPLREFRRGVEHAHISCLSFSLDKSWLGCASDRGTVHIFRIADQNDIASKHQNNNGSSLSSYTNTNTTNKQTSTTTATNNTNNNNNNNIKTKSKGFSLSKVLTNAKSPKKYFQRKIAEGEHSYAQIRGIPHPKVCAFVPGKSDTIAVAGLDDYGNGCLLISTFGPIMDTMNTNNNTSFDNNESNSINQQQQQQQQHVDYNHNGNNTNHTTSKGETRKIAYHRFFKKGSITKSRKHNTHFQRNSTSAVVSGEGYYSDQSFLFGDDSTTDNNGLVLQNGIKGITFGEDDVDGFVNIDAIHPHNKKDDDDDDSRIGNDGTFSNEDDVRNGTRSNNKETKSTQ